MLKNARFDKLYEVSAHSLGKDVSLLKNKCFMCIPTNHENSNSYGILYVEVKSTFSFVNGTTYHHPYKARVQAREQI